MWVVDSGITPSRPGGCELIDFRVRFWFGVVADFVFLQEFDFVVATRVCCGIDEHICSSDLCEMCRESILDGAMERCLRALVAYCLLSSMTSFVVLLTPKKSQ